MREVAGSLQNKSLTAAAAALQFQLLARRSSGKTLTRRQQETEHEYNHPHDHNKLNSINTYQRVLHQTFKHSSSISSSLGFLQWHLSQHVRAISSTLDKKSPTTTNPTSKPSSPTTQASNPRHAQKAASQIPQSQTLHVPKPPELVETVDVPIITLRSSRFRLPEPLYEEVAKPSYDTLYNGFSIMKPSKNALSNSFFAQLGRELDHVGTGYSAGKSMYQVARESYNSLPQPNSVPKSQTSMSTSKKILVMAFGCLIWLSTGVIVYSGILKTDNKKGTAAQQSRTSHPAELTQDFGPVNDDSRSDDAGTIGRSKNPQSLQPNLQPLASTASQLQTQALVETLESVARAAGEEPDSVSSIEAGTESKKEGTNDNTGMSEARNVSKWFSWFRFW